MLSRDSSGRFQKWAIRAIAGFLVVYLLGAFGVPTLIPYLAVLIAVTVDGFRSLTLLRSAGPRDRSKTGDGETIH
jgi:hypothetical protein